MFDAPIRHAAVRLYGVPPVNRKCCANVLDYVNNSRACIWTDMGHEYSVLQVWAATHVRHLFLDVLYLPIGMRRGSQHWRTPRLSILRRLLRCQSTHS